MDWTGIIESALRDAVGRSAIIYAIAAVGLNLHFGYTGLLNFGHVGFMAVGAYGYAVSVENALPSWFPLWGGDTLPPGVAILVGLLAAVVLALLLGIPTLRLRAEYLAIVTIAVGEIFRSIVQAPAMRDVTGGATGMGLTRWFVEVNPLPDDGIGPTAQWVLLAGWALVVAGVISWLLLRGASRRGVVVALGVGVAVGVIGAMFVRGSYGFGPWRYSARSAWILLVGWGVVLLAALFVALLTRSPWGRVLKSVREDEDAARALGKNAYGYKLQSLVIGGMIGALAGMFWTISQSSITPGNFRPETTFFVYGALFLGGVARTFGPVVGSMLLWGLFNLTEGLLEQGIDNGHIPTALMSEAQVGQVRLMLVGLGLAALVVFRPQGMFGDRREVALEVR